MDASFYKLKRFWYQNQSEIIIVLMALLIFFARLQEGDLRGDSAVYAAITKEMVSRGDWGHLTFNGEAYYGKPPLMFWLTGILFKYLGENTFTAKFWSCLFGVGCVWLTFRLGRRMLGERVGFVAAVVLTLTYTFVRNTIAFRLDSITTFCYMSGLYGLYEASEAKNLKALLWVGIATGIGLMVKGPGILLLPLIGLIYCMWEGRWNWFKSPWLWVAIVSALIIALPWHLYAMDKDFKEVYLGRQNLERFQQTGEYDATAWYFYLGELLKFYWPWLPFAVFGAIYSWNVHRTANRSAWKLFVIWFVVVAIGIMIIKKKYDRYLLPLFPLFAILAATDIDHRWSPRFWHWARPVVLMVTLTLGWIISCLPIPMHSVQDLALQEIRPIVRELEQAGNQLWVYGVPKHREEYRGRILFYLSLAAKFHEQLPAPPEANEKVLLVTTTKDEETIAAMGWKLYFKHGKYRLWQKS